MSLQMYSSSKFSIIRDKSVVSHRIDAQTRLQIELYRPFDHFNFGALAGAERTQFNRLLCQNPPIGGETIG